MSGGFNRLLEAVVRIDVREVTFEQGARRFVAGVGSGVILSKDGLVLTNAHVASPHAVEISITLPSLERVGAKLVGWDHWTDLALIRLDLDEVKRRGLAFQHAAFGDSDALYAGETVYAVGTPYGLTRTVTRGHHLEQPPLLRGQRGRAGLRDRHVQHLAADRRRHQSRATAAVRSSPRTAGSSASTRAASWAPTTSASPFRPTSPGGSWTSLVAHGSITRSYIGIVPARAAGPGALLRARAQHRHAHQQRRSRLARGPRRPARRRHPPRDQRPEGRRAVSRAAPADPEHDRQPAGRLDREAQHQARGQTMEVPVVTEKLESRVGEEWAFEKWGLSVRKVSRAYARENQLDDDTGVIVIGVQPGFPAAVAGLAPGDIITKINQQALTELEMLKRIYQQFEARPDSLLVEAMRDRHVSLYVLKP